MCYLLPHYILLIKNTKILLRILTRNLKTSNSNSKKKLLELDENTRKNFSTDFFSTYVIQIQSRNMDYQKLLVENFTLY